MRCAVPLALIVLAFGLAGACKRAPRRPPGPAVIAVQVVDLTPESQRPAPLDPEAVRAEVLRRLREARVFSVVEGRPVSPQREQWRLKVEVYLAEEVKDGQGLARAALRLAMEQVDGPVDAPRLETQGGGEQPYDLGERDVEALYLRVVTRTLGDLMQGLHLRARLRRSSEKEVLEALGSKDEETRFAGIAAAAERRLRVAVPLLIQRLGDPEEAVRDRALGALVEIGDRRAVGPLTRQTKFKDIRGMRKIVDAVASLGGREAQSYLELVASGHEHPGIRELAREALERMRRRGAR